ncbi:Uncharacterised protein [Mycobacteroides abscessus subsp. abscessus]|nr:Uncharacterised protein [Mycobacteroides abscessus subsp. abscessus]
MLDRTVRHGNSALSWNTMPRSRDVVVTGSPSARTRPASGFSSPASARSTVDLPQPDGPVSTRISPGCTVRLSSSTTGSPV